jgi:hypothetical protein
MALFKGTTGAGIASCRKRWWIAFGSITLGKVMGFAEFIIGPATLGRTRWLYPSYEGQRRKNAKRKGSGTPTDA